MPSMLISCTFNTVLTKYHFNGSFCKHSMNILPKKRGHVYSANICALMHWNIVQPTPLINLFWTYTNKKHLCNDCSTNIYLQICYLLLSNEIGDTYSICLLCAFD